MAATENTEDRSSSGFIIDGKRYGIPRLDEVTLDEERILYIYANTVLSDFAPAHPKATDDERRAYELVQMNQVRNPDFKRALVHIAYRREHPDESDQEIQKMIGTVSALEVDLTMLRGDADDQASSQKPQDSQSESNSPTSSTDSGTHTENGLETVGEIPEPTGIGV